MSKLMSKISKYYLLFQEEKVENLRQYVTMIKNPKWKMEKLVIYAIQIPKMRRKIIVKYITDRIGDEYQKWKKGDVVFISSQTGSGKTTFVLKTLLPHLADKNMKMLYLVNRSALKKQLDAEVKSLLAKECLTINQEISIDIELYQEMEREIISYNTFNGGQVPDKYRKYGCVVCDEAHYFLMDSNYNLNTIYSYLFIKNYLKTTLQIYISATIDEVQNVVLDNWNQRTLMKSFWLEEAFPMIDQINCFPRNIYEYSSEKNYDHVEIHILRKYDDIKSLVLGDNKAKWLIFVDSREIGKKIKKDIIDNMKVNTKNADNIVSFITSDYRDEEKGILEMNSVISMQKQMARVLIATSVLDNGVSLKDVELRNIIIITDTQTEFLQMLGRKRNNGEKIKLYIYGYSRDHFTHRKYINDRRLQLILEYREIFSDRISEKYSCLKNQRENLLNAPNGNVLSDEGYRGQIMAYEQNIIHGLHCKLLKELMNRENHSVLMEDVQELFVVNNGCLVPNRLAFQNIENLNVFYHSILEKFEKYGEDAFLREQLLWLGKTEEDSQKIIYDAKKSLYEKCREKVLHSLEEICEKPIEKNEWVHFKNNLRDDLLVMLNHVKEKNKDCKDVETHVNTTKKNNVCISKQYMKFLHDYCDIPFRLTCVASVYTVHRIEE